MLVNGRLVPESGPGDRVRSALVEPGQVVAQEDGFTLVELIVTMAVISTVLLGLLGVQMSALSTVTLSRERQQATDLANRTMEQLRALPYAIVTGGLLNSDATPALDSSIVSVAGVLRYKPAHQTAIDEILVTRAATNCPDPDPVSPPAADCPPVPLFPHVQSGTGVTRIGNVAFRVATYVTLVSSTPADTTQGYWLSVDVSWSSARSQGRTMRVSDRSQVYSPTGCLSTSTHPFSGPCQAYFDAAASSTPSGISLVAPAATGSAVPGNPLQSAYLDAPGLSAIVQSEQIVSTQSASVAARTRVTKDGIETPSGGMAASTGGTTDPATGESTAPADAAHSQSQDVVSVAGPNSAFVLDRGAGTVRAASTTKAVAVTDGCRTVDDVSVTSSEVCSSGTAVQAGALTAWLSYGQSFQLASIGAGPAPSRALAARFTSAGGPHCASTSGVGCIAADTARSFGSVMVGGVPEGAVLPDGTPLADDVAMVSVSGHTTRATAESGVGAAQPTASRAGTLTYRGGSTSIDLSTAAEQILPLQPLDFSYPGPSGTVDVTMSGDVTIAGKIVPAPSAGTCTPDPCGLEASSGSVLASVTYVLRSGGTPLGRFTVTVDLGASNAKTSYRGASSG